MQPSVSASRPLRPYLLSSGVSYEGELSCPGVQHHLDAALCTCGMKGQDLSVVRSRCMPASRSPPATSLPPHPWLML